MPNRIIKESIRGSDDLASVSADAERLFWRLIVSADDFGRFDARPKTIIGQCLTAFLGLITADQVNGWLLELEHAGVLQLYTVEDRPYLVLTKWSKHQRKRAKDSKFPAPEDSCGHPLSHDSKRGQARTFGAPNENENDNEYVNEFENGNVNENDNGASEMVIEVAASVTKNSTNSSSSLDPEFGQVAKVYQEAGFGTMNDIIREKLVDLCDDFSSEWVLEAMKESVYRNKRTITYMASILTNWRAEGGVRRTGGEQSASHRRSSRQVQATGRTESGRTFGVVKG